MLTEQQGDTLLRLARMTMEAKLSIPETCRCTEQELSHRDLLQKQGVFVTLHLDGMLRGCIGSLTGTESIISGVRRHTVNAAFHDYRFRPLSPEEAQAVQISVSVLSPPEKLHFKDSDELLNRLRPGIDGVIISAPGGAGATFLPQVWEQLPLPEMFLTHLCRKAGLVDDYWRDPDCGVEI
ncbi:MAG: AmmeMemoRadiSam system protein A, partial [Desulfobulbaceae bacterium]|nr:AmmeMemoRadiSam system protein A [Desulfobulbaceae bacterium]